MPRTANPNELSGGQKQRIALARSISFNPTVMLLDEPLSNLDPKMREVMRFEIKELQKRFNFTIILRDPRPGRGHGPVRPDRGHGLWRPDQQDDTPVNVYLRPANKFVFSFIGLSNFLDVEVAENRVYLRGARDAGPVTAAVPPHTPGKAAAHWRAGPGRSSWSPAGGVRGVVDRRGPAGRHHRLPREGRPDEVRVQRNVRKTVFKEGDPWGCSSVRCTGMTSPGPG